MNAPTPTGNFREDPDYAAGRALCAANGSLPIHASAALMRGYLDALAARQLDGSKANGPGMREPFTARFPDQPGKKDDAEVLLSLPKTVCVIDNQGRFLRLQEVKQRYAQMVVYACGGDIAQAARLLGDHPATMRYINMKRSRT